MIKLIATRGHGIKKSLDMIGTAIVRMRQNSAIGRVKHFLKYMFLNPITQIQKIKQHLKLICTR